MKDEELGTFAEQVEGITLDELPPPGDAESAKQLPEGMVMASPPLRPTSGRPTCPTCDSPDPKKHPAMQFEGEVQPCSDPWHAPLTPLTEAHADVVIRVPSEEAAISAMGAVFGDAMIDDKLAAYIKGYRACFNVLYGGVSESSDADIAGLYRHQMREEAELASLQTQIGDVQGWADQQDDVCVAPVPDELKDAVAVSFDDVPAAPTALEGMQLLMGGDVQIPADSQTDLGVPLEELDIEKVLREQAMEIERLQQQALRQDAAAELWADASEWFNREMAGTAWADMPEPLLDRVKAFVVHLKAASE